MDFNAILTQQQRAVGSQERKVIPLTFKQGHDPAAKEYNILPIIYKPLDEQQLRSIVIKAVTDALPRHKFTTKKIPESIYNAHRYRSEHTSVEAWSTLFRWAEGLCLQKRSLIDLRQDNLHNAK